MRFKIHLVLTGALLMQFLAAGWAEAGTNNMNISFLDIGQGDAIAIQSGDCSLLIDTGPEDQEQKLLVQLDKLGIKRLNKLIITHPHPDHYGNLEKINKALEVEQVFDNGAIGIPGSEHTRYLDLREKVQPVPLYAGEVFTCGRAVLEILHPPPQGPILFSANDSSLVFRVSYGKTKILLTADLSFAGEQYLLQQPINLEADILKVGHHGADDSASPKFLKKVQPKMAVISVGEDNPYGSPSPALLSRLNQHNIKTFLTARDQTVCIEVTDDGYNILTP